MKNRLKKLGTKYRDISGNQFFVPPLIITIQIAFNKRVLKDYFATAASIGIETSLEFIHSPETVQRIKLIMKNEK